MNLRAIGYFRRPPNSAILPFVETKRIQRQTVKREMYKSLAATIIVLATGLAGSAFAAGSGCPTGKEGVDVRPPAPNPASGVTDTVVGSIDVAKEPAHVDGRLLRLRKLVIQPGGVVPWHSHHDRPAIIVVTKGTIIEYASNCSVPIVHTPGDVTTETSTTAHWWRNETKSPVELYSADLFPTATIGSHEEHTM